MNMSTALLSFLSKIFLLNQIVQKQTNFISTNNSSMKTKEEKRVLRYQSVCYRKHLQPFQTFLHQLYTAKVLQEYSTVQYSYARGWRFKGLS